MKELLALMEKDLSVITKQNDCLLASMKILVALMEKHIRLQITTNEQFVELIKLAKGD